MWQTSDEAEKVELLLWIYFWLGVYTLYLKQETLKRAEVCCKANGRCAQWK